MTYGDPDPYGRQDGDLNHAAAVWCGKHTRFECDYERADGSRCHATAIKHWNRCKTHSGMPMHKARAKGYANFTAFNARAIEAVRSGRPPVDPGQAVMGMLAMSWERAHLFAFLLQEQLERDGSGSPVVDDGAAVAVAVAGSEAGAGGGRVELDTVGAGGGIDDGGKPDWLVRQQSGPGVSSPATGLIGHTYSGVKDLGVFATGEQVRGLVELEQNERDRVVKYAKVAHDMGIEQRYVELAERQGEALVSMIRGVLGRLGLTPEQQALVGEVVPDELRRMRELTAHPDTLAEGLSVSAADSAGSA